jgi:hypothetical protein
MEIGYKNLKERLTYLTELPPTLGHFSFNFNIHDKLNIMILVFDVLSTNVPSIHISEKHIIS